MILKKYVSDMWISTCENETASVYEVLVKPISGNATSGGGTGSIAESCFPCGTDPIMRVDIKGTAALRLLNHNAYQSLSGSLPMFGSSAATAAATEPTHGVDMCCTAQTAAHSGIAPSIVALNWVDQFNNDPIMNKLGSAELQINTIAAPTVFAAATTAQLTAIYAGGALGVTYTTGTPDTLTAITAATAAASAFWSTHQYKVVISLNTSCELQTQFTSCSFDTRDFYLMGGLSVTADLQDEVGQPCVACQGYVIPSETSTFKQRRTSSDTAINDMLLTESYMQSPYNQGNRDSSRFREQEQMSGIVTEMGRDSTTSTCNGFYRVYHLLHSVPRFNNPSGVFDNDQYHYKVYVKCSGAGAATTTINADWLAIAIDAGVMKLDGSGIVATVTDLEAKGGDY
jgi:hypothetical protein